MSSKDVLFNPEPPNQAPANQVGIQPAVSAPTSTPGFGLRHPKWINRDPVSVEQIRAYSHLPMIEAAGAIGISISKLKRLCRKYDIGRWPSRMVRMALRISTPHLLRRLTTSCM